MRNFFTTERAILTLDCLSVAVWAGLTVWNFTNGNPDLFWGGFCVGMLVYGWKLLWKDYDKFKERS